MLLLLCLSNGNETQATAGTETRLAPELAEAPSPGQFFQLTQNGRKGLGTELANFVLSGGNRVSGHLNFKNQCRLMAATWVRA